jgi:hypothetical protein
MGTDCQTRRSPLLVLLFVSAVISGKNHLLSDFHCCTALVTKMKMKAIIPVFVAGLAFSIPVTGSFLSATKRDEPVLGDISIPTFDKPFPLYSLGQQAKFPSDKLQEILKVSASGASLKEVSRGKDKYVYGGDRLVALYDHSTGQTSTFPKLESLVPADKISIPFESFGNFLNDSRIFPVDDTLVSPVQGNTLSASKNTSQTISRPRAYLSDLRIQRNISHQNGAYSVCGPGTIAYFSFASDGSIQSLSHRWRSAKKLSTILKPISKDSVTKSILAQLSDSKITNSTVTSVDFCFYDSGEKYIQPVYRYIAVTRLPDGANNSIVGYISAASKAVEPLPNLHEPTPQTQPTPPTNNTSSSNHDTSSYTPPLTRRQSPRVTVGRYVMRNDQYSPDFVSDANDVWNSLSSLAGGAFDNSQYYWDETFIYESNKEDFVDNVNLAFTVGHGNVQYFAINGGAPGVHIADIPSPGLGPGAGGFLSYWIIKACDVFSTPKEYKPDDSHLAFDVWWNVFNGLHAAMGYRTMGQVVDWAPREAAKQIALGAGVVFAWMKAVNESPRYNPDNWYDISKIDGSYVWWGRAAAVTVCGHTDDNVYRRENLGRPGCLQMWWYDYQK